MYDAYESESETEVFGEEEGQRYMERYEHRLKKLCQYVDPEDLKDGGYGDWAHESSGAITKVKGAVKVWSAGERCPFLICRYTKFNNQN